VIEKKKRSYTVTKAEIADQAKILSREKGYQKLYLDLDQFKTSIE